MILTFDRRYDAFDLKKIQQYLENLILKTWKTKKNLKEFKKGFKKNQNLVLKKNYY